jgi:hypothetical protein
MSISFAQLTLEKQVFSLTRRAFTDKFVAIEYLLGELES